MGYHDVLADLTNVDDDQLTAAHDEVLGRIRELQPKIEKRELTPEELTELRGEGDTPGLRSIYDQIAEQQGVRKQAFEEAYQAADAAVADLPDADGQAAEGAESGDQAAEGDATEQATAESGQQPGQQTTESTAGPAATQNGTQPVAAAASTPPPPGGISNQGGAKPKPSAPAVKIGITAGGEPIEFDQIGEKIARRLSGLSKNYASDGEPIHIVTMVASGVPDERKLKRADSAAAVTRKMDAVTSRPARGARGGICAPLAIDYSYGVIGVQGRPIRDALPGFQAERGGIQYRRDLSPATNRDADGPRSATGHWTMADDVAADDPADYSPMPAPGNVNPPTKALWVVDCPDTETAEVEAITLQIEFPNTGKFDPETIQNNQESALIWHDRHCENWLLGKLQQKSKLMTSAQVLGAVRDVLVTLDRAQAMYRSVHRLGENVQLRGILPFWVKHLMRADMARAMSLNPLDTLAVTDEQINGFFSTRNVVPVWHLDGKDSDTAAVTGPPALPAIQAQQYLLKGPGDPIPRFPAQVDMLLHTEGHFQHLDGGTLDLGIVRDSDLIERNRYRQFSETFEGVAERGVEALRLVASVAPTGESAGAIDVSPTA